MVPLFSKPIRQRIDPDKKFWDVDVGHSKFRGAIILWTAATTCTLSVPEGAWNIHCFSKSKPDLIRERLQETRHILGNNESFWTFTVTPDVYLTRCTSGQRGTNTGSQISPSGANSKYRSSISKQQQTFKFQST